MSNKRWFPEGQQDWRAEKAESEVYVSNPPAVLHENPRISGGWQCQGCGGCGRCECDELRRMQVEREQRDSIEQAAWLEAQLAMEAV